MPLYHTEDQAMLADTTSGFMADEGNIAKQLRHWRDRDCPDGFGHALWKQFAEMGFTGMLVDEDDGGLGMGHVEAGIVLEEIGRNLTPSPFLTSSVLAATALKHGSNDVKGRYLPGLIEGESVFAVAIDETAKHRPSRITTRAEKSGNGFKLTGAKSFVIQGASADMLVVAARTSGSDDDDEGLTLFAVPKEAANMSHDAVRLVDSSMATHTKFDGVELDGDAVIGEVDGGRAILNAMLNAGRIGSAAEGVGVARGAMDMTIDYLKQRKQFGRVIGEFQALQHRMVDTFAACENARSLLYRAVCAFDAGDEDAQRSLHALKVMIGKAGRHVGGEAIQLHGGMGMTNELPVGYYVKRLMLINTLFGDADYHRQRFQDLVNAKPQTVASAKSAAA